MLFHQAVISQNKCRYVQTMITYEENEAVSSGIIFKGFTPIELRAWPCYLVPEIFGGFKFCFHIIPCFCFMNVVEEPSLKGLAISGRQFWPSGPTKICCPASE